MVNIEVKTKVLEGYRSDNLPYEELMDNQEPVILKGAVNDWPLVRAGLESAQKAMDYLKSFYNGKTVGTFLAPPEINGRFFYNEDLSGLNFTTHRLMMDYVLDQIQQHAHEKNPPTHYIGSTTVDGCLPGLREHNDLVFNHPMFDNNRPLTSIWIGSPTLVCAHYDAPNNIACCAVGRRRFTLFPPDQIENLYPGPLDPTPGGQVISMVDFDNPDYEKYPKFKDALATAQVADLEPGDVLFYPSMWWHQVEATQHFNILINYWWNTSPEFMGTPMNVLKHALLSLRDRPVYEKLAWKHVFDYYIFGSPETARAHLPERAHGELAPLDDLKARQLRAFLINRLNR
jgi:Cupin-like domain